MAKEVKSKLGEVAGDSFFGAGGHYDVRGRKAVRALQKEQAAEREALVQAAGLSRLALAEVAAKERRGRRQILPNNDDVTLPWLFDQVVSELEVEDTSLYETGASKEAVAHNTDTTFLNEEINPKIPWWKKRKEKKITASLSDIFENNNSVEYQENVYKHRFSVERIHDPDNKIYSDLDKAASMMELREAVVKQQKRIKAHPKRDEQTKLITRNVYAVGSDERMYKYHYWGDRSIEISAPAADVLKEVRDDTEVHVQERNVRKKNLIEDVQNLKQDLILAQHTKSNIHKRWEERSRWYEKELERTQKVVKLRDSQQGGLDGQRQKTREQIFRNVQIEIMLFRDRARYLDEPMVHKCIRACLWRCCNVGRTCCGKVTADVEQKGCCFHCCSRCLCKGCINKFDVDTHLNELRKQDEVWDFKCLPCKLCCCCCRCKGYRSTPYMKPDYLKYEDDPFKAFQTRMIELEVELSSRSKNFDPNGGGGDGLSNRKKKSKRKEKINIGSPKE